MLRLCLIISSDIRLKPIFGISLHCNHFHRSFAMKNLLLFLLSIIALSSAFRLRNVQLRRCVKDLHSGVDPTHYDVKSFCTWFTATDFTLGSGESDGQISSVMLTGRTKCMQLDNDQFPNEQELLVSGYACNRDDVGGPASLQWAFTNVGDEKYLIRHMKTGMCLLPQADRPYYLKASKNCSAANNLMLWTKVE